jgi:hypothetical protein
VLAHKTNYHLHFWQPKWIHKYGKSYITRFSVFVILEFCSGWSDSCFRSCLGTSTLGFIRQFSGTCSYVCTTSRQCCTCIFVMQFWGKVLPNCLHILLNTTEHNISTWLTPYWCSLSPIVRQKIAVMVSVNFLHTSSFWQGWLKHFFSDKSP